MRMSHATRAAGGVVRRLCALAGAAALLLVAAATAHAQATGRITGVVSDTGGQPVVGARVLVGDGRLGATSDRGGRFTITGVPVGTQTLRAQRIGFVPLTRTVTVVADQAATVEFRLVPLSTQLATQVVVGYTTQQRRDVSDATAGVRGEELQDQVVATVDEALRGRLPGVQVTSSGEPGRPAQVIIRGQNFVSGNVSPLYVVDGMYLTQNPNLNPDDIESIEVLKDASAAAQYGAQAANGVIVIRTRRGQAGETRFQLRSLYGFQSIPTRIDMVDAQAWGALTRQAYANAGLTPPAGAINPTASTDWQDAVFRSGAIQNHDISASGGTANANFLVSGGVTDQQGAILRTGFTRYSFRVNSEFRRGRFTFGENVALSQTRREGLSGFPLIDVVRMLPTIPVRDPANPGGFGFGSDANPTFGTNPVGLQESRTNDQRSNQVIGTVYGEVALFRNLRYRLNFGLNYDDFGRNDFTSRAQIRFRTDVPFATLTDFRSDFTSLLVENLLTFDDVFREGRHRLSAVAGLTEQRQTLNTVTAYREGFTNEGLRTLNAGQTANLNNAGARTQSALRGFVARANYVLADRYILSGSFRRDASSRFGPGNRYATFGAGSAAWVISEEGFYRGSRLARAMDFLKLRASTGVLGNQDIGDYQFAAPIQPNVNYLFGGNAVNGGAIQLSLANPNIRWQSNRQTNVGLDLGFFRSSLTFTVDWYQSQSDGLLVNAPLPWSLGALGNPVVNAGAVRNRGFEFGAQHRGRIGGFQFNTTANLTTIRNRVLSLGNGGQPIFDNLGVARTAVGSAIGEFFVLQTAGIFQNAAEVQAHRAQPNAQPGDLRFVDRNNDGLISLDDRYEAGNGLPTVTGGLFMDVRWRSLDFGLNLRGQGGNKIFNAVRYWTDRGDDPSGFRADYRPWTAENPTTTPRIVAGPAGAQNAEFRSDRWIEDGSFLRVQNLVLGWTLPERFAQRIGRGVGRPRVYLNVQNAFTFTRFTNWDPEVLGFGNPLGRGIDDGAIYPNVRTVTLGLDFRL